MIDTPTKAIEKLWKEGFFKEEKKAETIRSKLSSTGFNFDDPALLMTLKRAKFLTRRGTRGTFTYIQKYPFEKEG